ncbi:hypothetical protein QWZ00_19220 [Belliella kenyensis]|uniref:hypothetical protein n=1 Tax=Belliella kenyensis TaxID=1472724 RepID=UPI0025B4908C|nr:hypothetical protein [Belliella kenyensis]MDN3605255.1 hypothetical protein [Belliella kenyensis]
MHLLSGGIESRFLFHSLALKKNLPCLTWTTKEGKNSINSDYAVSKTLKESFGITHFDYIIDDQIQDPGMIFDNFLKFGEGRIDHIFSYLDNFRLWRELAEKKHTSVIRGDHNFGRYKTYSEKQSKKSLGCLMYSDIRVDFFNEIAKSQNLPLFLNKKLSENLDEYSARLGLDFRLPYVNSSLNDLKLTFVEINNPLLNNSLVQFSKKLDPKYLLNKSLLKSINDIKIKGVPYAKSHYTENNDYVFEKYFKEFIVGRIEYNLDLGYFPKLGFDEFEINKLRNRLIKVRSKKKSHFNLKEILPKSIKKFLNQFKSENVSDIRIAFRLVLIIEMVNKINKLTQNQ